MNKTTWILIGVAVVGLGFVAYETGKQQQQAADSGTWASLGNFVKSLNPFK